MKNCIIYILVLLGTLSAQGSVLDNRSRVKARRVRPAVETLTSDAPVIYAPMIVQFGDQVSGLAELEALGAVVFYTRGDMALACVPRDRVGDIQDRPHIICASVSATATPACDVSRRKSGVDAVHSAPDLSVNGNGVVAGVCDIGFDPRHPAFEDRLGMLSVYNDTLATRTVWAPGTTLHNSDILPATDTDTETHGTHVANIMAGGNKANNPYYGAAPGATLAVSTSQLSDMALLCGIEDIIAFAREKDMPASVNLSMGSYMGPHDGSDLVNRYLQLLGKEALICFSAGNTGAMATTLRHDFTGDETFGTMLESHRTWNGHEVFGAVDLWSDDARPFEVQIVANDLRQCKIVYTSPWLSADTEINAASDLQWAQLFPESYVSFACGTDKANGRYNAYLEMYYDNPEDITPGGPHWARYVVGWRVRAARGTGVQAWGDGRFSFFRNYSTEGMSEGNSDFSVSNLCANTATACVGSWNSRNTVPSWGAPDRTLNFAEDAHTGFSSYGTLLDGRRLPHINAPGNTVVSAMSAPYFAAHPEAEFAHLATYRGSEARWFVEAGTSMASPMAAGIFALWLEADPTLTIEQALDIAASTANRDFPDISNPHWGAGAIDAAAGLAEVRRRAGVADVIADENQPEYFTISGLKLFEKPTQPGVYIEKTGSRSKKIMIRR